MKRSEIHVGMQYVVDVAPRHPITSPKICTVLAHVDAAGRQLVRVSYLRGEDRVVIAVTPAQVLYDDLERQRRAAVEAEHVRWWREERPKHAAQAAAAQREHDKRERTRAPFPARRAMAVA